MHVIKMSNLIVCVKTYLKPPSWKFTTYKITNLLNKYTTGMLSYPKINYLRKQAKSSYLLKLLSQKTFGCKGVVNQLVKEKTKPGVIMQNFCMYRSSQSASKIPQSLPPSTKSMRHLKRVFETTLAHKFSLLSSTFYSIHIPYSSQSVLEFCKAFV